MAMVRYLAVLLLAPLVGAQNAPAVPPGAAPGPGPQIAPGPRALQPPFINDLLDQLVGGWVIAGTAGNQPVREVADAEWVLNHQFLRIHRKQIDGPDEAVVHIGYDTMWKRFVAFRLDTRGAASAEIPGYGLPKGDNKLEFSFDYPTSVFKETWSWDAKEKTWQLLVEYERKNTKGANFVTVSTMTWRRAPGFRGGPRGPLPQRPQPPTPQ